MSRLTRDGTAEPVSRDQILRHARGQGNVHFPCSADHEQDWQPYPVDPYSAICDDHTYIHTYIHILRCCSKKNQNVVRCLKKNQNAPKPSEQPPYCIIVSLFYSSDFASFTVRTTDCSSNYLALFMYKCKLLYYSGYSSNLSYAFSFECTAVPYIKQFCTSCPLFSFSYG